MDGGYPARSLPDLIAQLGGDLAGLVRKEAELARAEVSEKVSAIGKAASGAAVGGVLLLAALFVLLQAAVLALSKVMDPLLATLIVGVATAAVGWLLLQAGLKKIKLGGLMPDRAARQVKKDVELVKEQTR